MNSIDRDESWFSDIPRVPTSIDWQKFSNRLQNAYQYSCQLPLANEHTKKALTILARFGLAVEKASSFEQSSVPIAKYIGDSLLNFSLENRKPCEHGFFLRLPSSGRLRIPARSHLLLLFLAERLRISIYVFSSRSRSLLFKPREADAERSIGFFHNVDSYHGIGEYLVLTASTHPFVESNIPTRPSPPGAYDASIPVAVFRSDKGKGKRAKRTQETEEFTSDDCVSCFETAW